MKTLKKLSLGLIAAGVVTGSASAYTVSNTVTVVHVAGSTAFRTGTCIAIIDTLAGKTTPSVAATKTVYAGYITSGKNVTNDSEEIFADGHIDGTSPVATTIVETNWTGSLTGVVDLVGGSSKTAFLNENDPATQNALSLSGAAIAPGTYSGGVLISGFTPKSTGDAIQLALSDSNKATIAKELTTASLSGTVGSYSTPAQLAAAVNTLPVNAGTSGHASSAGLVGVVPFQWFFGNATGQSYTPTNITQQQAAALFSTGFLPQSSFTGTNNGTTDASTTFYLTGRNEDSGTRIGALSESQFGVIASPTQWVLGDDSSSLSGSWSFTTTSGTVSGSGVAPFPAGTVLNFEPQISWSAAGHSGYNTGGNVQAALNITSDGTVVPPAGDFNTTAAYFIGYLGLTDGNSAIAASKPASALTYNGVAYSNKAVANGSYTFWTFEHAYRLSTGFVNNQLAVSNSIADNLFGRDADAIYSSGTVTYAENVVGSGVYNEGATPGKSAGNAGLLFDAGFTASRSLTEGSPVISNN